MTDIKLIDNKIIFDGHANTVQECNTITNIVNALEKSSDFSKVKVESGYAEFECTKELPYGHMIFVPTFDTFIYSNDGTILYGSDYSYDQSFSMTINSNNLTGEFQESQNGATVSGGTLFLPFNIIGLTQTIGKQTPDDGMFVGDTIADSAPNSPEPNNYYAVTALPITPEQQFNTDMNELCNIIKDKASTTGQKTIAQMKDAVDGIAKVITVSTLPESADDGVIAIIEEVE